MSFPASVSPCVEMKGHPLSRGFRWHQLPLNNLQVIPGRVGLGITPDLQMGELGGCRCGDKSSCGCGGAGIPADGGTQGSAEGGQGEQGALCMGGSAEKGNRGSAYGGTGVPEDEGTQSFKDEGTGFSTEQGDRDA